MTEQPGTVREISRAVAALEITPEDTVETALARIARAEPQVRAWTVVDADRARKEAAVLTEEIARGMLRGPLHGVPIGIKDEFEVAGLVTAMRGAGAPPATEDAACVARLRQAGAIVIGKTAMPLDGMPAPTRNPWHLDHTPGGTSAGSGAAVAARMVPLAVAEQTAGSTLRPAAFCGVAGFKPTYGRISRFGCYPFTWSRDHVGLIALDVADLSLAFSVLAGPDPRDPTSVLAPSHEAELGLPELAPPRVGRVAGFLSDQVEPAMADALRRVTTSLTASGASVVDMALPPEFDLAWPIADLLDAERAAFAAATDAGSKRLTRHRVAGLVPSAYYVQAERIRTWLREKIRDLFAGCDALVLPAALGPAPSGLASTGSSAPLVPWSVLGLPAVSISAGLSPDGLPLGVQLVGAAGADHQLLRVAAWCETVLGRLAAPRLTGAC